MRAENDRLAAAFDAAGVQFTRVADEAGWEWIEWDYEDESIFDVVAGVFDELYPSEPGVVCDGILEGDLAAVSGVVDEPILGDEVDDAAGTSELAPDDLEIVRIDDEFTPDEIAQRDQEVAALASGFTNRGVSHEVWGESPWASVTFDIANEAAIEVVAQVLATRG